LATVTGSCQSARDAVAAPAVGLRGKIVRLFSDAAPSPQRIVKSFTTLGQGVAPSASVGVEAGRAQLDHRAIHGIPTPGSLSAPGNPS
jgi:hypothetical protein